MALLINDKFSPRSNPPDANYPDGSIKNESVPGAKDGTPLDADWGNDYVGADAALFAEAGITPDGNPDTALMSQRLKALANIHGLTMTLAQTKASSILTAGGNIKITDRAGSSWGVEAGVVGANGMDVIANDAGTLKFVLDYTDQVSLLQLGAAEDAQGDGIESGTTDDSAIVDYAASLGIKIVVSNKCMISTSRSPAANSNFIGVLSGQISQFVIKPLVEVNNPFECANASNIRFNKLGFIGNNLATVSGQAGAIRFISTAAVTENIENLEVTECYFENFKHNYWVYTRNDADAQLKTISKVNVSKNTFVSKTGNDIDPTNIGVPATCVAFQGSLDNVESSITDIKVNKNDFEGTYMKRGIDIWGNCHTGEVLGNTLKNFGLNGTEDKGNYAVMLYSNRYLIGATDYEYDPSDIEVCENRIVGPRDCGIYMQGLNRSTVNKNKISGQFGNTDATLLKGAIVTNGTDAVSIDDNILWGNFCDIGLAQINFKSTPALTKITCTVSNNKCLSKTDQTIKIIGNTNAGIDLSTGNKSTLNLYNNQIEGRVLWRITNTTNNFEINVDGGSISNSALIGWYSFESSIPTPSDPINLNITNVRFSEHPQDGINHVGIDYVNARFDNNNIDIGTVKRGISISSSKLVAWNYNHFWASKTPVAASFCVVETSAEYTSWGNTTVGLSATFKESGFVAPTWAASENDKVQTLRSAELGIAPNKYILDGYVNTGSAWVEKRTLTGN